MYLPSKRLVSCLLLLTAALGLLAGCATNPVTGESELVFMSEDQELALGRRLHADVIEEYGRYDDPVLQDYVQSLGEELAASSHRDDLIYRFTVVDSPEVNAFALPGGYIYVTRGLMAHMNSEAELAAVLGHEIGHVTARHTVRQYTAVQTANLGISLGRVLVPELGAVGTSDLVALMGTAILRGYGREHELEADRLGAEYLARTGRDPEAMLTVIEVLKRHELFERQLAKEEDREPHVYHGIFATHPDSDARRRAVVEKARALGPARRRPEDPRDYLARLRGLTFGQPAKEGVLRGNRFFHKDLGFALDFPSGWRVENHSDRLLAVAPANDAMLRLKVTDLNKRLTPRQFLIKRLRIEDLTDDQPLTVNGLPGHTGFAKVSTSWGRRSGRFSVVFLHNRAYILVSAVKDKGDPRRYNTAILNTAFSFRPLAPEEVALASELRLDLLSAAPETRFSDLARVSRIPNHAEEQLRLLNGFYPHGEPAPGELLKIVR